MDKISYALGMNIAQSLSTSGLEKLEYDDFLRGLKSILEEEIPAMGMDEANQLLQNHFKAIQEKMQEASRQETAGFFTKNGQREGVVTLESGLQYEVLKSGDGEIPDANDKVQCHYHGTLIDGTVFDSSVQRGEPAVFPVNGVIQGWVEALQLMPVGSKWRLYVPSDLAYGSHGAGGVIGPDASLVFEVELLAIEK
ncbi:FKBP-type peptidyl-prolyl cis-trans isomerase [Geofilum rubicundum]|uniref:Peptidyl-prolyl cis-trans isomerase n=1 Tax=Geofilum rubicundum JCM 15548 TaxID=1236989 RepID=A0A0E9LY73_9BACT|nr:FKBP-type peptidyl-prolyl cis-trans isomerase [Geofilum rubicundum]GAO30204.1 FKBP-type peptidyl-prolyl cis-trans isomerase [Geofilum rubicundum JCM 15548]